MKENKSIDIERAIETVRLFSQPEEMHSLPTLEHFILQDGKLHHMPRSAFEKTLAFTKDCLACTFSSVMREKQAQKQQEIKGTLQQSLDLLKVYSSALVHMQKGSDGEKNLAKRVLMAATTYNAFVRQAKQHPHSLSGMLKLFLLKIAGWAVDEELIKNEIHIPQTVEVSSEHEPTSYEKLLGHKISHKQNSSTAKKVLSLLQSTKRYVAEDLSRPKEEELDLFRVKAMTLLQTEKTFPYSLEESISLVQACPIEYSLHEGAYLLNGNAIELRMSLSNFPGIETKVKGAFLRDTFHPELVQPIKESFQISSFSFQSGFPHPLQYTGIALHEKLIPNFLLRPQMCPKLERLLETKRHLSQELIPNGLYHAKAKELLRRRKELFMSHKMLFDLQKKAIFTLIDAANLNEDEYLNNFFAQITQNSNWYEELAHASYTFNERVIAGPIRTLQEEWLLKNTNLIQKFSYQKCQDILLESIELAKEELRGPFAPNIVEAFGTSCNAIHLLQISEHLNFAPPQLSPYEYKLLLFLFRQQLIFAYEMQELDPKDLEKHLTQVLLDDIALFEESHPISAHTKEAQKLAQELIHYYALRFEGTTA